MESKKIAVVGAGIAGLTCAYSLKQAGYDVTVYEKEALVGGRMSSRTKDNLVFDIGANHLSNVYDVMKEVTKDLDIEFVPMDFCKYGVFKGGEIFPIKGAVSKLSQMRLALYFLMTTKKAKLLDFFNLSTAAHLDNKNAYDELKKRIGKDAADYIVDPFSTTYQFHSAREISLSVVNSIMSLLKFRTADWYLQQTKPGGMIELPNRLANELNVQLETPVEKVVQGEKVVLTVAGKEHTYDAVVMAATATTTQRLLDAPTDAQTKLLSQVKYASSISLAFRVPKESLPDTAIVWVPRIESSTISGYTNERMKGGNFVDEEAGTSLICAWLHEDYSKEIMNLTDEEIYALGKTELVKYCPWYSSVDELESYDIQRWPEAMPKFYTGSVQASVEFLESHQGENNVFLCGDYLNSPWTEGALRCGQRVAESVIEKMKG